MNLVTQPVLQGYRHASDQVQGFHAQDVVGRQTTWLTDPHAGPPVGLQPRDGSGRQALGIRIRRRRDRARAAPSPPPDQRRPSPRAPVGDHGAPGAIWHIRFLAENRRQLDIAMICRPSAKQRAAANARFSSGGAIRAVVPVGFERQHNGLRGQRKAEKAVVGHGRPMQRAGSGQLPHPTEKLETPGMGIGYEGAALCRANPCGPGRTGRKNRCQSVRKRPVFLVTGGGKELDRLRANLRRIRSCAPDATFRASRSWPESCSAR